MDTKTFTKVKNVEFRQLTTFRIGGRIKHFFEVKTKKEVVSAVSFAKKNKLPIFIIGGGSDILVSDKPYQGVVIRYVGESISFKQNSVTVKAGVVWDKLVEETVNKGLQGIECLSGIPGSVGGAPVQNIGAYGQELKDTFVGLTAYDIKKEKFVTFNKTDCEFGYRESFFKKPAGWQKFIITDVTLSLKKDALPEIKYDSLKNYLHQKNIDNPSLIQVRQAVLKIRETKFEDPKDVGNAGSFFKNPIINEEKAKFLRQMFSNVPCRLQEDGNYKCSAGWLIEQAGWKGKSFAGAQVSPRHALVLVNPEGKATAREVKELAEKISQDVYKKFGIKLEPEVQYIGFG